MTNLGGGPTGAPFTNRLRVDGAAVAATSAGLSLNARETKSVTTSPALPAGTHTIELSLDDDGNVAESRENNNRFKVVYALKAPCGPAKK
jgi:subtilase family serine protease